jgi:hypothetical protein
MFFSFFLLGPLLFSKLLNFSLLGHFKWLISSAKGASPSILQIIFEL